MMAMMCCAFIKLKSSSSQSKRSEEHTSELQSPCNLVCRLLLEKKEKLSHLCDVGTFRHERSQNVIAGVLPSFLHHVAYLEVSSLLRLLTMPALYSLDVHLGPFP